jgi:hypothetical protein
VIVTILQQTGRGVPVILPDDVKTPLEYLANDDVRRKAGINGSNIYVFANCRKYFPLCVL